MTTVRVLLVDDSNTIRKTGVAYLTEAGFEVLACEDGFDALAKIAHFNPDIVITDIEMPRVDGYQEIALLRSHPAFQRLPIIVLSGKAGVFNVARGKLIGCTDYLTKPFSKEVLLSVVKKHTDHIVEIAGHA